MNVPRSWFFFTCSLAATAPVLPSASAACGPGCAGVCFSGQCLFADSDVDDEDSFRSAQARQSPSLMQAVDPPEVARDDMPFEATGLRALRSPGLAPQPMQLPQIEPLSATATSGLGFHSMGVLDNKAQELSYELQRAEAHEALLQAQNEQLRQQLQQWKTTGANIAQREAKVVALLGTPASKLKPASAAAAPLPGAAVASEPSMLQKATASEPSMLQNAVRHLGFGTDGSHSYRRLLFIAAGILLMAACFSKMWCFLQRLRKGDMCWANNSSGHHMQPVLRAMGLAQYKVEISEIHLGSLFAGSSDIRVNFRMGNGMERRTKVLKNADGTFLRFDDVLELSVCSSDYPCTICVTDRRGDLAHVELPASELVRLATRPHQEYFRTELSASRALGEISDRRPYVAMRMRNLIVTPASSPTGTGSRGKAAAAEQRAYGSFAV